MSKNRGSISISGKLYTRLKAYAIKHDLSISSIVETAVAKDTGIKPPPAKPYRRYRGVQPK
jgi:hypothetical protein